ncbi:hypothetical protein BAE44_0015350, partial [Dichanthelium oligosanthes]
LQCGMIVPPRVSSTWLRKIVKLF